MFKYLNITKDIPRAKKFFENMLAYTIAPHSLHELIKSENQELNKFNLIDVRMYEDYIKGHIPFAQHMPFESVEDNLKIIEKEKPTIVYTYDKTCQRAKKAIMKMLEHEYPCIELIGGFHAWKHYDYDVVKTDSII